MEDLQRYKIYFDVLVKLKELDFHGQGHNLNDKIQNIAEKINEIMKYDDLIDTYSDLF